MKYQAIIVSDLHLGIKDSKAEEFIEFIDTHPTDLLILNGDIKEASKNGTADHNNHPGLLNKTGHIGFLGHGDVVRFRNIRIKKLK